MNLIPAFSIFGPADATGVRGEVAVFTIDLDAGRLVGANAAACALWGLGSNADGALAAAVDLDAAMPALRDLRAAAPGGLATEPRALTFWTRSGTVSWTCAVCWPTADVPQILTVTVLDREPMADGATATAPPQSHGLPRSESDLVRLSHELRTPLAAIASLADVMATGGFGPLANARYEDYARSIRDTARHALGVVGAMLEPCSSGASLPEQTFTEVDLGEVIAEAAASLEPMAAQAGLRLSCELGCDLPRVIADRIAVQQIVLNLATNTLKHAGPGACLVLRTGREPNGETWLEAEDDGPGIEPRVIEAVLGGSAAEGLTACESGLRPAGLGLRLSRALAEANGARMAIADAVPRGARVRITFSGSRTVPV